MSEPTPESPPTAIPVPLEAPKVKRKAGRPPGTLNLSLKRTYDPEQLADDVVATLAKGHGILRAPTLRTLSEPDKRSLSASLQEPVEAFNDRLALKLRALADKAASRIEEKLDSNQFKSGELGFIFSVVHDKRLSLDGSRALNNASVNLTVNNFGPTSKEALLSDLDGMTNVTPKPTALFSVGMDSPPRSSVNS